VLVDVDKALHLVKGEVRVFGPPSIDPRLMEPVNSLLDDLERIPAQADRFHLYGKRPKKGVIPFR